MTAEPVRMKPVELIRRPSPENVRTVWPSEPYDFTPWLAENIDLLDVLEIGTLTTVEVEKQIPGTNRSLDILAQASDGRLVAIENQFAQADHDHFTRGLAYAVGLQAKALVVIAERHLGEFRAIADYLNHAAEVLQDSGIGVFLVEFGVSKVEGFYVPRFEVVARPNAWLQRLPGGDKVPMLASIDEFYEKCTPESRPRFREIIEDWERTQPGAYVNYNAQRAVALYRSNPMKGSSGRTAVYLLETNGWLTINRGYLLDGGLGATEEDVAAFDAAMTAYLPGHQRTEKNYYPKLKDPDPAQVRSFNQWLDGALGAASSAANAAD